MFSEQVMPAMAQRRHSYPCASTGSSVEEILDPVKQVINIRLRDESIGFSQICFSTKSKSGGFQGRYLRFVMHYYLKAKNKTRFMITLFSY
jgi:hypothetical protein